MLFSRDICFRFIRGKSKSSTKVYLLQNGAIHSASQPAGFDMRIQNKKKIEREKIARLIQHYDFFFSKQDNLLFFYWRFMYFISFWVFVGKPSWNLESRRHPGMFNVWFQSNIHHTHTCHDQCSLHYRAIRIECDRWCGWRCIKPPNKIHPWLLDACSVWFISSNTLQNSIKNDKSSYFHIYICITAHQIPYKLYRCMFQTNFK